MVVRAHTDTGLQDRPPTFADMFTYFAALFAVAGFFQPVLASIDSNSAGCSTSDTTVVNCADADPKSKLWATPPLTFDAATTSISLASTGMPSFSQTYITLRGLNALTKITISNCVGVTKIAGGTLPSDLIALKTLYLKNNAIAEIEGSAFDGVASLTDLDLSQNELTEVTADTFSALENLESLNLNDNKFSGLDNGVFKYLSKLNDLEISNQDSATFLVSPEAFSFRDPTAARAANGLQALTILKLENNKLTEITQETFQNLPELKQLYLENNVDHSGVTRVDGDAFKTNLKLVKIDLSYNELASLDETIFSKTALPLLTSLNVAGKYWNCCTVEWMLEADYVTGLSSATCARPESAKDKAATKALFLAVNGECAQDEPDTPAAPVQTDKYATKLDIEWAAVNGNAFAVLYYTVEYKKKDDPSNVYEVAKCAGGKFPADTGSQDTPLKDCKISALDGTATLRKPKFTIERLTEYTTYDIRVVATSQYGTSQDDTAVATRLTSADGTPAQMTTKSGVPGSVASLVVSPNGAYSVNVYFTRPIEKDRNGIITQYTLTIKAQDSNNSAVVHQQVCINSINRAICDDDTGMSSNFTGLNANTKYDITVTPETVAGAGEVSQKSTTTLEAKPARPEAPTVQTEAESRGSTYVSIEWAKPDAAAANGKITAYTIDILPKPAGTENMLRTLGIGTFTVGEMNEKTKKTIKGLEPSTQYTIQISASTNSGPSDLSPGLVVNTNQAAPDQQDVPEGNALSASSFLAKWEPPAVTNGRIIGYTFQYVESAKAALVQNGDSLEYEQINTSAAEPFVQVLGLTPATTYDVSVLSFNSLARSNWSDVYQITTSEAAPTTVSSVAIARAKDSVMVEWVEPATPNGFILSYRVYQVSVSQYVKNYPAYENLQKILKHSDNYTESSLRKSVQVDVAKAVVLPKEGSNATAPEGGRPEPKNWEIEVEDVSQFAVGDTLTIGEEGKAEIITVVAIDFSIITVSGLFQGAGVKSQVSRTETKEGKSQIIVTWSHDAGTIMKKNFKFAYLHDDATPHMTYRYSVSACNSISCSPLEKISQATTFEAAPETQYAPTVKVMGASEVLLRWSKPQYPNGEIIKYEIHKLQTDDESPSFSGIPTDVTDGKLSITIVNLNPDTVYRFTVTSFTSQGASKRSAETPGTTESQKPSSRIATLVAVLSIFVIILSVGFMWEHRLRRQNIDIRPMDKAPLVSPFGSLPIAEPMGTFSQEKQLNNPFADGLGGGRERSDSESSGSSSGSSFDGDAEA